MKINWNTKYNTIAVYVLITVFTIVLFYLGLSKLDSVLSRINIVIKMLEPFIFGFAIAYVMNFILKFYEDKVFKVDVIKKIKLKSGRGISLFFTYITSFFLVFLFLKFVLPQLIDSIIGLVNDVPSYISKSTIMINKFMSQYDIDYKYMSIINDNLQSLVNYLVKFATNLLPKIGMLLTELASKLWNIVLGTIISIYLLADKEKMCALSKKILYGLFPKKAASKIVEIVDRSNDIFGKFLWGKIIDSSIIGVLAFIVLSICKMPYTLLISVIIGITNIIPFFGPFIGAVPSFFIILFVSPVKAVWFLVIVFIIQQIDGNIIGPKILGDKIGISAFWILFSITIAGKLLGVVGMVIGVPLFAVIYSLIKEYIESKLIQKNMKVDTADYMVNVHIE